MRRREFIALVGGAVATRAARGEQLSKIPTIGLLSSSTAAVERPRREAFVRRLSELGWIEGRTKTARVREAPNGPARSPRSSPASRWTSS